MSLKREMYKAVASAKEGNFLTEVVKKSSEFLRYSLFNQEIFRNYSESVFGIDLGTTNSCVSVMKDGKAVVIPNKAGKRTTPSSVLFKHGRALVGEDARKSAKSPESLITSAKRLMGRKYTDPETIKHIQTVPYKVVPHTNGDAWIEVDGKRYSPQKVASEVLRYLKDSVEYALNQKVRKAVITVPAYFNDSQRKATKVAGEIAGLSVLRVVNEPTAAALSYGIDTSQNGTVAVYDLGGGTFDVSILEIRDGIFEVRSTNGNSHLGGEDFDASFTEYLCKKIEKEHGIIPKDNPVLMKELREAAEHAKCVLSYKDSVEIDLFKLKEARNVNGARNIKLSVKREEFEKIIEPLIDKTMSPCKEAMLDGDIRKGEIDNLIVVGGMTRIPAVRKAVEKVFGKPITPGTDPDEAVATGAAIQGGILAGEMKDCLLIDVAPLSLGIETLGGIFSKIVEKNTSIPTKKSQTFTTSEDGQDSVTIKIYEGERPIVSHNKYLGEMVLSGIPPLPKGRPKIDVIFEADANGIFTVTAKDKETGAARNVRIEPSGGLTKEEIDALIEEAEISRLEDEKEKALIETRQKVRDYIRQNKEIRERIGIDPKDKSVVNIDSKISDLLSYIDNPLATKEEMEEMLTELRKESGRAWRDHK